ncbi:hypothetical protein FGO68_gene2120 [Halteria grandinella]|uniref:Uncharacterized protein n=1 Tax=Halteria grandinella TaxID=5974 RepID=A0A8J8NVM7_HALGN|nr:hypothetical protein FGO68_gene2120 [Halteria grandinella]
MKVSLTSLSRTARSQALSPCIEDELEWALLDLDLLFYLFAFLQAPFQGDTLHEAELALRLSPIEDVIGSLSLLLQDENGLQELLIWLPEMTPLGSTSSMREDSWSSSWIKCSDMETIFEEERYCLAWGLPFH